MEKTIMGLARDYQNGLLNAHDFIIAYQSELDTLGAGRALKELTDAHLRKLANVLVAVLNGNGMQIEDIKAEDLK